MNERTRRSARSRVNADSHSPAPIGPFARLFIGLFIGLFVGLFAALFVGPFVGCTRPAPLADASKPSAPAPEARPILATPGQLESEALVLEILKSPDVARATDALEQIYLADARGKTPSGAATARRAAESTTAAAAHAVVNGDPARPIVFWGANAPHTWFGMTLPRAGYGIENPDNIYRSFHVDGAARYEIKGRFIAPGPAELHFTVMDMRPQKGKIQREGGEFLASLRSDAMAIDEDGSFTITLDSEPANGRANHMQIPEQGHFPVHVRDLFTDWETQKPVALEVRRVEGPPAPPVPDLAALSAQTAARIVPMGSFWLAYNNQQLYAAPPNRFSAPRIRPGGRGVVAISHFEIASDEALVVTVESLGARSIGFQLADPWGVAYEYVDRTSSLNQNQAIANADGSRTYVIAANDPGVHNWLDPDGQTSGIMLLRWQVLEADPLPGQGIRDVRVVALSELRAALPEGTRFVTPAERASQRSDRARQFRRRIEP